MGLALTFSHVFLDFAEGINIHFRDCRLSPLLLSSCLGDNTTNPATLAGTEITELINNVILKYLFK